MSDQTDRWLVSFDTDRIKNYIFATNSLKEIRGASALLVEQDGKREKPSEFSNLIYAGGGGGASFVDSQADAEKLVRQIERDFREATKTATITAVALPPSVNEASSWFGRRMSDAGKELQRQKSRKGELGLLPVAPYMRLCDSCGYQPAERRLDGKIDPAGDLLCESCARKRERGKQMRWEEFEQGFVQDFRNFVEQPGKSKKWANAALPCDLNALGDLDESGYVGFVIMDGNRMGKLLDLMAKPENYTEFSKNLADLLKNSVFKILEEGTKPVRKTLPFEIVLIGGDDVMLFTTASFAVPFALKVLQRFEHESQRLLEKAGLLQQDLIARLREKFEADNMPIDENEPFYQHRKLTMAAGVVICHPNFPIPALVEIGETLLKNAKKKCAEIRMAGGKTVAYDQGTIDFQVVTGSAMELDMARATVPHCRPYRLNEMAKLWEFARSLRELKIPRSQLQMVYDA
ncbi:MAG: Cas10/Cmr2 second palm domain-containing protein, partial [bacterium]